MDDDYERKKGRTKLLCVGVAVLTVLVIVVVWVVIWMAFKKAKNPTFKVQRMVVPKFKVDDDFTDEKVVLAVDMNFYLETDNYNSMVSTKLQNMMLLVNWDEYQTSLGQTDVAAISQDSGTTNVVSIESHGETVIKKKRLKVEEMKLDVTLSGDVVFFYGPFNSKPFAFIVTCKDVSTTTRDYTCDFKLFSEKIASNQKKKKTPDEAMPVDAPVEAPSPGQAGSPAAQPIRTDPVQLIINDNNVILDNGILAVTIKKPDGYIYGIEYNDVPNILDVVNPEDDRGYWDLVWTPPRAKGAKGKGPKGKFDRLKCALFRVVTMREDQIEISFSRTYNPSTMGGKVVPMDIDIRYIMLRGESGVYSYNILQRQKWPGCHIPNARLAFKLCRPKFRHIVVTDSRQRKMPLPEDRMKGRGHKLAYPEAVKLENPIDAEFKGEVDDKYQYSDESHDIRVHGWISNDPPMGFWQITPSYEFRTGGPNKQFLTSHVGPSVLAMFVSAHYSGEHVIPQFADGEPWKKVLGPVFMYVNTITRGKNTSLLWEDAKKKMLKEAAAWPYSFAASVDFPTANQRANVTGRLFVHDKYANADKKAANGSYIGLATPGEPGSWQIECKGYQFWTKTEDDGRFIIDNVRPGNYSLFGWVPGFPGDFKYNRSVNVSIGHNINLGDIIYKPPRDGPTLWEIGEPERTAKEFFVPDPDPMYVNKLYVNHTDKFRQYGLWEKYAELYPHEDLVYTVNVSDYRKDWFYAQVTRKSKDGYDGTTWQIKFNLTKVAQSGSYKLRISVAGASNCHLEVRVNEPKPSPPIFAAADMGSDNAIARHGIHGIYWHFDIDVPGDKLKTGQNTMYLTQTKSSSPFQGILYDYLRLEAPSGEASSE